MRKGESHHKGFIVWLHICSIVVFDALVLRLFRSLLWKSDNKTGQAAIDRMSKERSVSMENVIIIRVVSGLLFAIVLGILVQRRRTQVN